ncbi:hypothetical protein CQP30_19905 [Yersinia pestis]|uniref:Uncharacterized protein n=1 Tax=Yersinia pestis biovar Orientalis str. IP275 TaxID=373665 RepID=A0AAV3BCL6_YERPE|nr:conserved hypothetical protein [Yersinia pestis Angola]ADV97799.1 hypothetical protein YPC_1139 [Yersinia pestis biovar Medievalis str. Harbin 35]AYW83223.1 hypothetical protein EGX42_09720 [Yersinia pestis]EDR32360.1 conserved hypothetical protein [Yersinia pestis biovar Orientalis str. IP275]EDR40610.1 conserved hypothetical protein [Yersinia pestis biovar Orientalis str. F1991016]EDR41785.1 conserved hypothetical protein [Yersinia pestis biovar Antiqua str. E1979001]EDR51905.1 conserved
MYRFDKISTKPKSFPHLIPHLACTTSSPTWILALCSQPSHDAGLLSFPHLVCIGKWEVGDLRLN